MVFLIGILPFLVGNFADFTDESFFDITLWAGLGCVFVTLPLNYDNQHPRVYPRFLPPETFFAGSDNYECSHLCESYWRQFYRRNHLSTTEFYLPPVRCINPLHLTGKEDANA